MNFRQISLLRTGNNKQKATKIKQRPNKIDDIRLLKILLVLLCVKIEILNVLMTKYIHQILLLFILTDDY